MKIALVSLITEDFYPGFVGFIKSLLVNNPSFNYEFLLLHEGVTKEFMNRCQVYYSRLKFKKLDLGKYTKIDMSRTHDRLKSTYYKLEIFNLVEYDRIVFIDLDTVVIGNILPLFLDCQDKIYGAQAYNYIKDNLSNRINSGVMVINKEAINEETYSGLIDTAQKGFSMPDQKTINIYFKGEISYLGKGFNIEKRMYYSKRYQYGLEYDNIRILHYVSSKPWDIEKEDKEDFSEWEKIWHYYYNYPWKF